MQIILHDSEMDHRKVECPLCHWKGDTGQLKRGDYMELTQITEIFCPACDKYLGFIQHETEGPDQND